MQTIYSKAMIYDNGKKKKDEPVTNVNTVAKPVTNTVTQPVTIPVDTGKVYAPPTKGAYMTNTMAMPTYSSPTAGAQYGYSQAAPTWQWDDSARPGEWQWNEAMPDWQWNEARPEWQWDQERPTYTNQYQDQINSMVDAILNREKFSYDYNTDPLYQMYADAYTRNGQQAMKDTYAQAAARTGGFGSSYANTAAQTQYNQYMAALNDKVPELYKLAYSMYQDEGNTMRNNLGMIQGLESTDYGRYMDALGQYNTDRNFSYGQYQDALNQYNTDRNFSYGQYQDALGQWNADRNFSYGQYQDEWDRYYNDRDFSYGQYSDDWNRWATNRDFDYDLWQDNLARQEAAAQTAYNNQLAAYNANQKAVDEYNRGVDAKYKADLDAYNKNTSASSVNATTVTTNKNGYQWNGKNYTSLSALQKAIDAADISDSQWAAIKKSMLQNHVLTDEEYSRLFG